MISGKTIFISPLDWGMGHSTRCVPIIKDLLINNKVIIGVTNLNKDFFEQHFQGIEKINIPSYNIRYSKNLPVWLKILFQFSKIKKIIRQENKLLEKVIKENNIDLVISDNRFGLHNKNVECVFITHQLKMQLPFFSSVVNNKNKKYIYQFNKVWVPDYKDVNDRLAGELSDSRNIKIPVEYIGPKSALQNLEVHISDYEKFDYLILLSGVEPQRTILEQKLLLKFNNTTKKIVLVRACDAPLTIQNKNITSINFVFGIELKKLILKADVIICRSGYSTLMDLHVLEKKKIILIPTPGQPEQEYLAAYWQKKFNAVNLNQKAIAKQLERFMINDERPEGLMMQD